MNYIKDFIMSKKYRIVSYNKKSKKKRDIVEKVEWRKNEGVCKYVEDVKWKQVKDEYTKINIKTLQQK